MSCRPAAVAGMFYPRDPDQLSEQLAAWLLAQDTGNTPPKGLIVPHAGYVYSGRVAASAYRRLAGAGSKVTRVVVAGPNHRVPLAGVAIPSVQQFDTPLGSIDLDTQTLSELARLPFVQVYDEAHRLEHALEVQLPFLKLCLASFKLVPLVVGDTSPQQVAELFERLWGDDQTLFVISSDLSHFLRYEHANRSDSQALDKILHGQSTLVGEEACGCHAVNGFLLAARSHGLQPELLDRCNSGDVTGDYDRVVGYASLAFYPD